MIMTAVRVDFPIEEGLISKCVATKQIFRREEWPISAVEAEEMEICEVLFKSFKLWRFVFIKFIYLGYNNNFTERQGGFHDSRGSRGGRNWNRDEGDDRRSNFRSGNRTQRWSDNQRQDDGWNDEENPQSNQNDSNNEFSEENQNNFENNESRGNDDCEQTQSEDVPPGTDDYSEQQQQHDNFSNNPPSESFNPVGDNEDNSNVNDNAVVENAGNTTPLCDENEAKE